MKSFIKKSLADAKEAIESFMTQESNIEKINQAMALMCCSINSGGKILACGNGGSLCDASHFAEELTARYRHDRRPLPAIAINDPSYITCAINDFDPTEVFSRFVEGVGKQDDLLLAISTSGNSANVVKAAEAAKKMGMKVIALTGKDGGKLANFADVEIRAPKSEYSDRVQEIHIKVIHILVECIEREIVYANS